MANVIKHKRGSGSDPGASDLVVGELAIRTDTGKLFTKMDSGALAEIAGGGSDIAINTLSSSSGTGGGSATFNGSAYRFTLSSPPAVSAQQLLVSINGVIQKPVAGTGQPSEGFSVDGNDIILGDAPATGADFFILTFRSLGVSVPADNSVTSAKIVDGAIVNADINASAAIARTKLANVDLVDDTSPQLGGDLATNGNDILIADNDKLKIGTGNDLIAYHDGTSNIITNVNGNLFIQSAAATDGLKILNNGAVELFHAGSKKFETSGTGASVTGALNIGGGSSGGGVAELIELNGAGNDLNDGVKLNFARAGSDCGSIVLQKVNNNNTTDFILNTRLSNTTSETVRITGGGTIKLNGTDNFIHTNSDTAKIAIFGGSTNSVSHGGVVSMTGINHSAGCFTDLAAGTGGHLQFRIGTSHAMRIDSSRNVGIGTTSPATLTHIYDSTDTSAVTEQFRISGGDRSADTFETGFRFFTQAPSANGNRHVRFISNANTGLTIQPYETSSGNAAVDRNISLCPDGGSVGIGTASPGAKLTIEGAADNVNSELRLTATGVASGYLGSDSNGLNIGTDTNRILFKTAVTGGGSVGATGTVRMQIHNSTFISIGTSDNIIYNHSSGDDNGVVFDGNGSIQVARTNDQCMILNRMGTDGTVLSFHNDGTCVGFVSVSGATTTYSPNCSDRTLKKNFGDWTENTLSLFKDLTPQTFNFLTEQDTDTKHKGFIAQNEVDKFPEAYPKIRDDKYWFDPMAMVPYLMKALQEAVARIEALEAK